MGLQARFYRLSGGGLAGEELREQRLVQRFRLLKFSKHLILLRGGEGSPVPQKGLFARVGLAWEWRRLALVGVWLVHPAVGES